MIAKYTFGVISREGLVHVSFILFTNTTYLVVENTFTILIDKACR
jgi:hypothetical protein